MSRLTTQAITLSAAVGNAVCASQTPAGAGALTIDGANASGGVYTAPNSTPRHLSITTAADESAKTFTIVGTDRNGAAMTYSTMGAASATTTVYPVAFNTITSVTVSAATAGAITVGFAASSHTGWIPLDRYATENVALQAELSSEGGLTYLLQATLDDVQTKGMNEQDPVIIEELGDVIFNGSSNLLMTVPLIATAIRFKVTGWTSGSVTFSVLQK